MGLPHHVRQLNVPAMPAIKRRSGIFGGKIMRMGSLARPRSRFVALFVAAASMASVPMATFGQARNASYDSGNSSGSQGPKQALYMAPGDGTAAAPSRYVDANGKQMIVPAGYCECSDCSDGCGYGGCEYGGCHGCGPGCQGEYPGCYPMGCGGTDPPIGYDLMNDVGIEGDLVDQRGPHYFDIRVETVFMQRDKSFDTNIDFTAQNVGGPVVLSSRQLDIEDVNWGFRAMGRYDICPLSVVEFGYTGIYNWNDKASFTDPTNNLFSLFSRPAPGTGLFGTSPAGVNLPNGPNPFTERANTQSIELSSDLQTAEISYRRYWLGYIPRVSGTLLAGVRYTRVNENFVFASQGSEQFPQQQPQGIDLAALEYKEDCENNLAGFQTGGDIWVSLMQGVRIGSEAKAGIYNNHSRLANRIATTPAAIQPPALFEEFKDDNVAFIGEGSFDVVFDILPSLSIRAGYEVLFLNELVLAGDNFNQTSPYGNQGPREPFVVTDGELFYHGGHVGLEYCW